MIKIKCFESIVKLDSAHKFNRRWIQSIAGKFYNGFWEAEVYGYTVEIENILQYIPADWVLYAVEED